MLGFMLLKRWIYVVYRVHEDEFEYGGMDYDDSGGSNTVEVRTPIAGYEKREDAVAHIKAAQALRGFGTPNKWDPFLPGNRSPSNYVVGELPLVIPSSAASAPEEMEMSIQVLRDLALETANKQLGMALPPLPVVFPLWSTGGNSKSEIGHYFDGKPKLHRGYSMTGGQTHTSLCGVYLPRSSYNIFQLGAGKRQCLTCLGLLNKPLKATG